MDCKIFVKDLEDKAKEQIDTMLQYPQFADKKIRIMPDAHAGAGCVIGFTADLKDVIVPNLIGVDIGCGVRVTRLGKIDIDFQGLEKYIRNYIPSGFDVHNNYNKYSLLASALAYTANEYIKELYCLNELQNLDRLNLSVGTLGGGNHFIELDVDDEGCKYLVIHTGSRNLGKQVADYYQNIAKEQCKKDDIIKGLSYLKGDKRNDYIHDMQLCQKFAEKNRRFIAQVICEYLGVDEYNSFESVHNYLSPHDNMIRKGAISARKGEQVVIPLNMRDGCILGTGLGNADWNNSAPHGAGRRLGRKAAKEQLTMEDFEKEMKGIYTESVNTFTLDEAPDAYKDKDYILDYLKDTVEINKVLKPIYNFKAK